jgi:probable HAF family extracellular repeat protein
LLVSGFNEHPATSNEFGEERKMKNAVTSVTILLVIVSNLMGITPSFQGLGSMYIGTDQNRAEAVSADGSTVVGRSGTSAFRWTASSGMTRLELAGNGFSNTWALGVSGDGSVVVGVGNAASGQEAFRWTSSSGMGHLGDLAGDIFNSGAEAVSADGSIVVGFGTASQNPDGQAVRWTSGGGMVGLGDLPGGFFYSYASGVSASGSVVVGFGFSDSGQEAFRWTSEGGMVGLGDFAGGEFRSNAYGVSADGSVVVGFATSALGQEAFRWTSEGGMVGLGDFAAGTFRSRAYGVSADGSVVVGFGVSGSVYEASAYEAFYWTASGGMQNLNDMLTDNYNLDLTGWHLTEAIGVSGDGLTIVGNGTNPQGFSEPWIATIPEPATMMLIGLGGIFIRKFKSKS